MGRYGEGWCGSNKKEKEELRRRKMEIYGRMGMGIKEIWRRREEDKGIYWRDFKECKGDG